MTTSEAGNQITENSAIKISSKNHASSAQGQPAVAVQNTWEPLDLLRRVVVIIFVSLLLGLIIPGMVAFRSGVFYESQIKHHLPHDAQVKMDAFDAHQAQLTRGIDQTSALLLRLAQQPGKSYNLPALIELRTELSKERDAAKPPIVLSPLYLSPIMLLWVVEFVCLGCLNFVLPPSHNLPLRTFIKNGQIFLIGLGLYVLYEWSLWFRNFVVSRSERRTVYSFANYDVSPAGFFAQEVTTIIFSLLLALLWQQWLAFFSQRRSELQERPDDARLAALDFTGVERLSNTFLHWQVTSLLLAVAFITFTGNFWTLIARYNDARYLIPAINIHCIWMLSWLVVSAPLLLTWYSWQSTRMRAIATMIEQMPEDGGKVEATLKSLQDLQPIAFWNLAASGVATAISFALPLIQAVIHK